MSGEKKEFEMTERQYFEMRLQEIATTQRMFNKTCAFNLELMAENIKYLKKEVDELKEKLK